MHGNWKIDGVWLCENCEILQIGGDDGSEVGRMGMKMMQVVFATGGDVTPLHRVERALNAGDGGVVGGKWKNAKNGKYGGNVKEKEKEKGHNKSSYMTLPTHIDEALGVIGRELEEAAQVKLVVGEMKRRVQAFEQEVTMWKGRAELLERDRDKEGSDNGELEILKVENTALKEEIVSLRRAGTAEPGTAEEIIVGMR